MPLSSLDRLMHLLAKMPGLGPRSARRAALDLLKKREGLMLPLIDAMHDVAEQVRACPVCGNWDVVEPCAVCRDAARAGDVLCVVEDVADLWAMERARAFRGRYHVLGGTLSALDGVRPTDLRIDSLAVRVQRDGAREVILALSATVEGQTTAHYVAERLRDAAPSVAVTKLAHGLPIGGELDYLDDGTLVAALQARQKAV